MVRTEQIRCLFLDNENAAHELEVTASKKKWENKLKNFMEYVLFLWPYVLMVFCFYESASTFLST